METAIQVAAGEALYISIPASSIRGTVDHLFPYFAKYPAADTAAGLGHRFKEGHDLIIDVANTIKSGGAVESIRHIGHIILTDLPTKAGIPIPGFSQSGLGEILIKHGIPKGWLSFNICDFGVGILAVSDGHADLIAAISGHLTMSVGTFFDTYVEGTAYIIISAIVDSRGGNPTLIAAGAIENMLAGVISTWHTYSIYVDPVSLFGHALGGAVFGSLLSIAFNQNVDNTVINTFRGGAVSSLAAINSWFAMGAAAGLLAFKLGALLREQHEKSLNQSFYVNHQNFLGIIESISTNDSNFKMLWESGKIESLDSTVEPLDSTVEPLDATVELLDATIEPLDAAVEPLDVTVEKML